MQKLVDTVRSKIQDRASDMDKINKQLRSIAQDTENLRGLNSVQMEASQRIEILEGKAQELKLTVDTINKSLNQMPKQQANANTASDGGATGDMKVIESQLRQIRDSVRK
jgi:phage-related minor tail protein